jgi:hypothetical protein
LFKDTLSILVFISLSDLSLLSTLELSVGVIKKLKVEQESELELDLVSSEVSIVSELEFELTKISIKVLKIVLVFSLIYR